MTSAAELERIARLEERFEAQDEKLDEIKRLVDALVTESRKSSEEIAKMAPTVQHVSNLLTTAKVVGSFSRSSLWIAAFSLPIIYWMQDRWHLIAQLFKRLP